MKLNHGMNPGIVIKKSLKLITHNVLQIVAEKPADYTRKFIASVKKS